MRADKITPPSPEPEIVLVLTSDEARTLCAALYKDKPSKSVMAEWRQDNPIIYAVHQALSDALEG